MISGCSNYNSSFDCKAGLGLGCTPARKVYKTIKQGELKQKIRETHNIKENNRKASKSLNLSTDKSRLKIWLAPLKEQEGNISEERYVDLIVK
jgi:hypothetical protein